MEINEGKIGAKGKYELDLENGKVVLKGDYNEGPVEHTQLTKVDVIFFLELLKEKMQGPFNAALIGFAEQAIKNASVESVAKPQLSGQ